MHEMLTSLTFYLAEGNTSPVPSTTDSSSLKIAIITAIGVVIAAAITAAATTFQRRREPTSSDGTPELIAEVQRRSTFAEAQVVALTAKADFLTARVDELEGYCWQNGIDPRTGDPIVRPDHPGGETSGNAPVQ